MKAKKKWESTKYPCEVIILKDTRQDTPVNATGMRGTLTHYIHLFDLANDDGSVEKCDTPFIRLHNGDHIYGYQCWWDLASEVGNLAEKQEGLEEYIQRVREEIAGVERETEFKGVK